MAIADMFLKLQGVTGESGDAEHKGEIEVVSWSWGMQNSTSAATGQAQGRTTISELQVVKRVDQATPTLMMYVRQNRLVPKAKLTVRKAGQTPLEYFTIEMERVRITSVKSESEGTELVERVGLAFAKVLVAYTPQGAGGGAGGGTVFFEDELYPG